MATLSRNTAWDNASAHVAPKTTAQKVTLSTAGKYVDKDIEITVDAMVAGETAKGTDVVTNWKSNESTPDEMIHTTTKPTSGTYYTLKAEDNTSSRVTKAGYLSTGNIVDDSTTYYVKQGTCTVSGGGLSGGGLSGGGLTAGDGSVGLSKLSADSSSYGAVNVNSTLLGDITDGTASSEPNSFTSGYFIAFDATGSGTVNRAAVTRAVVTRAAITDTHTAGYIKDKTATTVIDSTTIAQDNTTIPQTSKASNTKHKYAYIPVNGASLNASATDPGTSYTSKNITLASGGYLKIDAGYIPNTKISLADLVPDDATIEASTSSPYILTGYTAYDKDGGLITGGINDGTINGNTSGGASKGTIPAGKQIKIGAGYYSEDIYYTAQDASATTAAKLGASGTATGFTASSTATSYYVTPSANTTASGYATAGTTTGTGNKVYIPAGSVTTAGSASSVTVTGATIGVYDTTTSKVAITTTNTVSGAATYTNTAGYLKANTTATGSQSFTTTGKTATFNMDAYDGTYTVTDIS